MAILTMDDVVNVLANTSQKFWIWKPSIAGSVGGYYSLWPIGNTPNAASTPSTGVGDVPTASTTGAIPFTNSNQSYLMNMSFSGSIAGRLILYDRLWQNSGLSGTQTADTSIGTMTALTRPDVNGANTELWMEIYSQIGTNNVTLTCKYTNSSGTTGKSATLVKGSNNHLVQRMQQLTLASGDIGVKAVESYSWSSTTGAAGNFGFVILRRIAEIPFVLANGAYSLDFAALGLPQIYNSAALAMMALTTNTTTGDINGSIVIGQK